MTRNTSLTPQAIQKMIETQISLSFCYNVATEEITIMPRAEFASRAMQALIASPTPLAPDEMAKQALIYADSLINALNKFPPMK